ncbi:triose-phosphate isomerase [Candidatus Parcubacteria bacterium]|nr:triose-phosphate isomerase [Candidatus Parcubacteria bacterium]
MSHKGFLIAGNWKMHPDTLGEAKAVFASIARKAKSARKTVVVIAPPAPFIRDLGGKGGKAGKSGAKGNANGGRPGIVRMAAQDVSEHHSGAFTGSVSARELRSAGAEYAIIGHSERRAAGDTGEIVAKKAKQALEAGLRVILCVGETERDGHARYLQTVREQVHSVLSAIDKKLARWMTIAYEPVWAIGKSYDSAPKPQDIHEMSIYIRKTAAEVLGKKSGLDIPVLYGGSVDAENAKAILKDASIDGLLVGRESLDPKSFGNIIEYADSI